MRQYKERPRCRQVVDRLIDEGHTLNEVSESYNFSEGIRKQARLMMESGKVPNKHQRLFNKRGIHKITRFDNNHFFVRNNDLSGFEATLETVANDTELLDVFLFMNKMVFELIIEKEKTKEFFYQRMSTELKR